MIGQVLLSTKVITDQMLTFVRECQVTYDLSLPHERRRGYHAVVKRLMIE